MVDIIEHLLGKGYQVGLRRKCQLIGPDRCQPRLLSGPDSLTLPNSWLIP